jgi:hypothetical protein
MCEIAIRASGWRADERDHPALERSDARHQLAQTRWPAALSRMDTEAPFFVDVREFF